MDAETRNKVARLQESLNFSRPPEGLAFVSQAPRGAKRVVVAVPRCELGELLDLLDTILNANSVLEEFHTQRRASV